MKNNNHGVTTIEILISICIIGMVLLFLFNMFIQVRKEDEENNIQSTFLINQSTFIKRIEEDIANYGLVGISSCGNDFSDSLVTQAAFDANAGYHCIRFEYGKGYIKDRIGYLVVYKYYTKYAKNDNGVFEYSEPQWMIKYSRGYYRSCGPNPGVYEYWEETSFLGKEIPAEITLGQGSYARYTYATGANLLNAATIVLPIIDESGAHYDINLAFTFNSGANFYCQTGGNQGNGTINGVLSCECLTGDCNATQQKFNYTCDY